MSANRGMSVENGKFVLGIAPINATGSAHAGAYVSMKHYRRLAIIIQTGTWAGGTSAVTLEQATAAANANSDSKALAFTKYHLVHDADSTPDDVASEVTVASNTFNLGDNANVIVIEVRAEDLDLANGFCYVCAKLATPGANDDLVSVLYYLYEGNFSGKPSTLPSALS